MVMQGTKSAYIHQVMGICHPSTVEREYYCSLFEANGYVVTDRMKRADVILVLTCIVTDWSEMMSDRTIEKSLRDGKRGAEVIICGCFASLDRAALEKKYDCFAFGLDEVDLLKEHLHLSEKIDIYRLCEKSQNRTLDKKIRLFRTAWCVIHASGKLLKVLLPPAGYRLNRISKALSAYSPGTYHAKISAGCINNCSYCVIKKAKGAVRSRDISSILEEIGLASKNGYQHFVLVSDDFSSFGIDNGETFIDLLKAIFGVEGNFTISLPSFQPIGSKDAQGEFIDSIVPGRITCIEYVLQSGSDRILGLMNRKYTVDNFIEASRDILEKDPEISLRTEVLVGFPGETEEDLKETMDVIATVNPNWLGVNYYSDRKGTPSYLYEPKVPLATKKKRRATVFRHFIGTVLHAGTGRRGDGLREKEERVGNVGCAECRGREEKSPGKKGNLDKNG